MLRKLLSRSQALWPRKTVQIVVLDDEGSTSNATSPRSPPRERTAARTSTRSPLASTTLIAPTMFLMDSKPPSERRPDQTTADSRSSRVFCCAPAGAMAASIAVLAIANLMRRMFGYLGREGALCTRSDSRFTAKVWTQDARRLRVTKGRGGAGRSFAWGWCTPNPRVMNVATIATVVG